MRINRTKDNLGGFALACMIGFILASFFIRACGSNMDNFIEAIRNQL